MNFFNRVCHMARRMTSRDGCAAFAAYYSGWCKVKHAAHALRTEWVTRPFINRASRWVAAGLLFNLQRVCSSRIGVRGLFRQRRAA